MILIHRWCELRTNPYYYNYCCCCNNLAVVDRVIPATTITNSTNMTTTCSTVGYQTKQSYRSINSTRSVFLLLLNHLSLMVLIISASLLVINVNHVTAFHVNNQKIQQQPHALISLSSNNFFYYQTAITKRKSTNRCNNIYYFPQKQRLFATSLPTITTNDDEDVDVSSSSSSTTTTPSSTTTTTTTNDNNSNNNIYTLPTLYDIAFGYRNYIEEVQFLLQQHSNINSNRNRNRNKDEGEEQDENDNDDDNNNTTTTRSSSSFMMNQFQQQQQEQYNIPKTILEIGAGPGRHSITALLLPYYLNEIQQQNENDEYYDDDDDDDNNEQVQSIQSTDNNHILFNQIPNVYCIDLSNEMKLYSKQLLINEMNYMNIPVSLSKSILSNKFHYHINDMRNFTLLHNNHNNDNNSNDKINSNIPVIVDTVWILLGTLQHMLTNTDVLQCLHSISNILNPNNGTIFIELPHPRESTFNIMDCTRNQWNIPIEYNVETGNIIPSNDDYMMDDFDNNDNNANDEDENDDDRDEDDEDNNVQNDQTSTTNDSDGGTLSIIWGDNNDIFDPITQIRQFSIRFDINGLNNENDENANNYNNNNNIPKSIQQIVPMRLFTAQEIDALARCAGYNVVAMYGALEEDNINVNDEETSYRLVCVLQKQQ